MSKLSRQQRREQQRNQQRNQGRNQKQSPSMPPLGIPFGPFTLLPVIAQVTPLLVEGVRQKAKRDSLAPSQILPLASRLETFPVFLVNKDWTAEIGSNLPPRKARAPFSLPFESCVFEFNLGGLPISLVVSDQGGSIEYLASYFEGTIRVRSVSHASEWPEVERAALMFLMQQVDDLCQGLCHNLVQRQALPRVGTKPAHYGDTWSCEPVQRSRPVDLTAPRHGPAGSPVGESEQEVAHRKAHQCRGHRRVSKKGLVHWVRPHVRGAKPGDAVPGATYSA